MIVWLSDPVKSLQVAMAESGGGEAETVGPRELAAALWESLLDLNPHLPADRSPTSGSTDVTDTDTDTDTEGVALVDLSKAVLVSGVSVGWAQGPDGELTCIVHLSGTARAPLGIVGPDGAPFDVVDVSGHPFLLTGAAIAALMGQVMASAHAVSPQLAASLGEEAYRVAGGS